MVSDPAPPEHDRSATRLAAGRNGDANTPARDFGAYSVSFDGKALGIGETIEAAPGVKLTRRC